MVELFIFILSVIFALWGLSDFLQNFRLWIISPKKRPKNYNVVFLNDENYKEQLDYIISKNRWYGRKLTDYIIAVRPENVTVINEKTISENYNIMFCDYDMIMASINLLLEKGDDFYGS